LRRYAANRPSTHSTTTEEKELRSNRTTATAITGPARAALPWRRGTDDRPLSFAHRLLAAGDVDAAVRALCAACGGGAFLGLVGGQGVFASREYAVLVLGAPRSGKTSGVVVPSVLAFPGAETDRVRRRLCLVGWDDRSVRRAQRAGAGGAWR
jgi:hypothetical protein